MSLVSAVKGCFPTPFSTNKAPVLTWQRGFLMKDGWVFVEKCREKGAIGFNFALNYMWGLTGPDGRYFCPLSL